MNVGDINDPTLTVTDDLMHFVNASEDTVVFADDFRAELVLTLSSTAEADLREALFRAYTTPTEELAKSPFFFGGGSMVPDATWLAFKGTALENGSVKYSQFLYPERIFKKSLIARDAWPRTKSGRLASSLRGSGTTLTELIEPLSEGDKREMLYDIFVNPASRVPLMGVNLLTSTRADFAKVTKSFQGLNNYDARKMFASMFHAAFGAEGKGRIRGVSPAERAFGLIALRAAILGHVVLPALFIWKHRQVKIRLSKMLSHVVRPYMLQYLVPDERREECQYCVSHAKISSSHGVGPLELAILYCCSSYGRHPGFSMEPLLLLRTARRQSGRTGAHGINNYARAALDYFGLEGRERESAASLIESRVSAQEFRRNPFGFLHCSSRARAAAWGSHLASFERRSKKKLQLPAPAYLREWADCMDGLLEAQVAKTYKERIRVSLLWLAYLHRLGEKEAPRTWAGVGRRTHVRDFDNPDRETFFKIFTEEWGLAPRSISPLAQMFALWRSMEQSSKPSPFDPKLDWKNKTRGLRTHRKAIPPDLIETLITENARADENGPYALARQHNSENPYKPFSRASKLGDGTLQETVFPLASAVIDVILNLGVRSGSARWLDTGQGDEFLVDVGSKQYVRNPRVHATAGRQNGAIQLVEVASGRSVLSLVMLVNKTQRRHEVPYLPAILASRLNHVRELQDAFNPIDAPVVGSDDNSKYVSGANLIYPLFRDPSTIGSTPVSRQKLVRWWYHLLQHCEPIFNAKRREALGEDIDDYRLFDAAGNPKWDIHSIRVSVITALLEQGVPPSIVQLLVGHQSPLMTLHYEAVDNAKTHDALSQAFETRRVEAAKALSQARTEEEYQGALNRQLGGTAGQRESEGANTMARLQRETFGSLSQSPSGFSVFSHGICPGGNCCDGGERWGASYKAVHRDKACSRCRYRITGPAFLQGLELNANILMSEIHASQEKERQLHASLAELHDSGEPAAWLESRVAKEREFRDELWADWAAEFLTIQRCIDLLNCSETDRSGLPAIPSKLSYTIEDRHHLTLLHKLLKRSEVIVGGDVDLPSGWEQRRNEMLYEIAANNDLVEYLFSLPQNARRQAITAFGDIVTSMEESGQLNSGDGVQALIDGRSRLPNRDSLLDRLKGCTGISLGTLEAAHGR